MILVEKSSEYKARKEAEDKAKEVKQKKGATPEKQEEKKVAQTKKVEGDK
jgi:hypothetical protein